MPICKNCGSRITKFDKDICPICGERNPIDEGSDVTQDITGVIGKVGNDLNLSKMRKRKTMIILAYTLGFVGAPFFYIGYVKNALVWMLINLVLAVPAVLLPLLNKHPLWVGFVIMAAVLVLSNIIIGTLMTIKHNFKDSYGELIK